MPQKQHWTAVFSFLFLKVLFQIFSFQVWFKKLFYSNLLYGAQLVHKKLIAALPDDHPVVEPLPQGLAVPLSKHASFGETEARLILIDGKAVVYRAYYKLMCKNHEYCFLIF